MASRTSAGVYSCERFGIGRVWGCRVAAQSSQETFRKSEGANGDTQVPAKISTLDITP